MKNECQAVVYFNPKVYVFAVLLEGALSNLVEGVVNADVKNVEEWTNFVVRLNSVSVLLVNIINPWNTFSHSAYYGLEMCKLVYGLKVDLKEVEMMEQSIDLMSM